MMTMTIMKKLYKLMKNWALKMDEERLIIIIIIIKYAAY